MLVGALGVGSRGDAPRLDLDEGQRVAVAHDQVDLTTAHANVSRQHHAATTLQVLGRELLAALTERAARAVSTSARGTQAGVREALGDDHAARLGAAWDARRRRRAVKQPVRAQSSCWIRMEATAA